MMKICKAIDDNNRVVLETDEESMLGYFSSIICQLDTDIAIEVMKDFGKAGENQAMAIKVNYGY